jgi:hypothetical protein
MAAERVTERDLAVRRSLEVQQVPRRRGGVEPSIGARQTRAPGGGPMKSKTTALLAGALLLLLAAPATAAHTYVGNATATGLELTLGGQGLTVGFSEAAVQSSPSDEGCGSDRGNACARGAGALVIGETAEAFAPGSEGPADATALPIPEPFAPLLTGEIGTARAEAGIDGNDASARGDGGALTLSLTATQTLAESVPLQDALDQISDAILTPITEGDPTGLAERLQGTVDQLSENLDQAPLLTLAAGPSTSTATDIDGVTTATATAQGAVLVIAPTPENLLPLLPEGLIIVEVGAASATATTDQTAATAGFDPALVRLRVFDPTTGEFDVVEIAPGQSMCGGEGTPLETCITVGGGTETVEGAGAAATAAGVSITALADPLPTLRLALAETTAAVASAAPAPAAAPTPAPTPEPVTPAPDLPRTGGALVVPALALLGVGGAGWAVRRRR